MPRTLCDGPYATLTTVIRYGFSLRLTDVLFCLSKTTELLFQNRKIGLNIHLAHKIIFIVVYGIFSLVEELEFSDF